MSPDAMPTQANADAQTPAPTAATKPARLTGPELRAYLAEREQRRLAAKAERQQPRKTTKRQRKAAAR